MNKLGFTGVRELYYHLKLLLQILTNLHTFSHFGSLDTRLSLGATVILSLLQLLQQDGLLILLTLQMNEIHSEHKCLGSLKRRYRCASTTAQVTNTHLPVSLLGTHQW
jgi:hypothetical protein